MHNVHATSHPYLSQHSMWWHPRWTAWSCWAWQMLQSSPSFCTAHIWPCFHTCLQCSTTCMPLSAPWQCPNSLQHLHLAHSARSSVLALWLSSSPPLTSGGSSSAEARAEVKVEVEADSETMLECDLQVTTHESAGMWSVGWSHWCLPLWFPSACLVPQRWGVSCIQIILCTLQLTVSSLHLGTY